MYLSLLAQRSPAAQSVRWLIAVLMTEVINSLPRKKILHDTPNAPERHSTTVDHVADTRHCAGERCYHLDTLEYFNFIIAPTPGAELCGSYITRRNPSWAGAVGDESGLPASIDDP